MANVLKSIEGKIIQVRGMDVYGADFLGVVKGVDLEKRKLVIIGTDETIDRDGDIISMRGWMLENYLKNPVFLWGHDYSSVPIASAEKIIKRKEPARMEFHMRFPSEKLYPFADMVLNLYAEKIINASSVGFIPMEWEEIQEEEGQSSGYRRRGRKFLKQELLELSGCAVPSNPNAIQSAIKGITERYGISAIDAKSFADFMVGKSLSPPEKVDDIIDELEKATDFVDEEKGVQISVPNNFQIVEVEEVEPKKDSSDVEAETGKEGIEDLKSEEIVAQDDEWIDEKEVLKPYPNEHACRLESPGKYERFARKNCFRKHDGKCIDFIFGYPKEGGGELQAMRYKKDIWTAGSARSHCSSHGGSFEAASSESDSLESFAEELQKTEKRFNDLVADQSLRVSGIEETLKGIREEIDKMKESLKLLESGDRQNVNVQDQGKGAIGAIMDDAFNGKKGGEESRNSKSESQSNIALTPDGINKLMRELKQLRAVIQSFTGGK